MQPHTPSTPSTPPSDVPKQASAQQTSAHHTRQEDAEYIGIEILKDTVGPPPSEDTSPRLEQTENKWPASLGQQVGDTSKRTLLRSFLDMVKRLFSRKGR